MITLYRWASVLGAPLMMGVGQTEAALTIRVEMKAKREAGNHHKGCDAKVARYEERRVKFREA